MSHILRDDSLVAEFAEESNGLLAKIETEIIALAHKPECIDSIFRAIHSVKGSAGILEFRNIAKLTHNLETILDMIRSRQLSPNREVTDLLLEGVDLLKLLFNNIGESDDVDISAIYSKLDKFLAGPLKPEILQKIDLPISSTLHKRIKTTPTSPKKILIVEDELINRKLLEESIKSLHENIQIISVDSAAKGLCHFFTNCFDLVFLDIMMPRIDGNMFITIVEENLQEGLLKHKPNIVVQTAIQSLGKLTILAQNECVQEIIRKPIKAERIRDCVHRYC
jgi:chemotaxis protein histidine kinase CheA